MLINCPRCGFSQPKDQYCASCGVNMETYRPQKTSLLKRLFSHTLFQVALVVGLALSISYYTLKTRQSTSQASRRKAIQVTTTSSLSDRAQSKINESASAYSDRDQAQVSVELQNTEQESRLAGGTQKTQPVSTAMPPSLATTTRSAAPEAAENVATTTSAAAVAAQTASVNVRVSYYEVSRNILAYWIQASRTSTDANEAFNFGVINQELFGNQIRYQPLKTESTKVALNSKATFQAGVTKDNNFVGFAVDISVSSLANNRIGGNVMWTKQTTARPEPEQLRTYLDIPANSLYFLHWKNDLAGFQNDATVANVPPFQILKSKQFFDQQTELVMIIESSP